MKKHKISIPEPCHENWDKMIPNENGRFCLSCSKTVIDFTSMLPEEIQHFFIQNQNQKICGRFKESQLNTVTIQIPSRVLYTQTHYPKMFLLALFIAMGTTLFSCQNKNGDKKKIDKIEVVSDTLTQHGTIGITVSDETISPSETSKETDKLIKSEEKTNSPKSDKNSESSSQTSSTKSEKKNNSAKEEPIYNGGVAIETNAEFPGGIDRFYTFFGKEYKKPENSETANLKIRLSFAVEKNGSATYLQSDPPVDNLVEKEIIRVLSVSPKWEPGETNGKKARRLYSLPIALP